VPLNAIWEGAGNVIALDIGRAIAKSPQSLDAFLTELSLTQGLDPILDRELTLLPGLVADPQDPERQARRIIERLALCWAGSLLTGRGDPAVARAFIASRLAGDWGQELGTLPSGVDIDGIAHRAVPAV